MKCSSSNPISNCMASIYLNTDSTIGTHSAGVLLSLVVFRLIYFGFPFPNTYYAKVSPDRIYSLLYGWRYLAAWWDFQPLSLALALATFAALAHGVWLIARGAVLSGATRAAIAVSGVAALGLLLPLYVGGDHFG